MKNIVMLIGICGWLCLPFAIQGQPEIKLEPFATGLSSIADIAHPPDDSRLFVLQQNGIIRLVDQEGNVANEVFLDVSGRITTAGNEQGLLGLAFHPDFQDNGRFFINYTGNSSAANESGNTIVSAFTVLPNNPDKADSASEKQLLEISQPFSNHNGGDIRFGPEGYLYISTGDGGAGGDPEDNAQDPQTLLGKLLRIDVDAGEPYGIPADNPFVGDDDVLDEIYATGLRNPWRNSFDRYTGDLWIADVGQGDREEVNFEAAPLEGGKNYGWRCYEGSMEFNTQGCDDQSAYEFPVFDYEHSPANCGGSITGGYVYRGALYNALFGKYLAVDFCTGAFYVVEKTADGFSGSQIGQLDAFEYTTFGQNQYGELFLAATNEGTIYRINDTSDCRPVAKIKGPDNQGLNGKDEQLLEAFYHPSLNYEWSRNGEIIANSDTPQLTVRDTGTYQLKVTNPQNGCSNTGQVQVVESVTGKQTEAADVSNLQVYPNPAGKTLRIKNLPQDEGKLRLTLYSPAGKVARESTLKSDQTAISTANLPPGIYVLTVQSAQSRTVQKVVIK